jgi:hypothetical protein
MLYHFGGNFSRRWERGGVFADRYDHRELNRDSGANVRLPC